MTMLSPQVQAHVSARKSHFTPYRLPELLKYYMAGAHARRAIASASSSRAMSDVSPISMSSLEAIASVSDEASASCAGRNVCPCRTTGVAVSMESSLGALRLVFARIGGDDIDALTELELDIETSSVVDSDFRVEASIVLLAAEGTAYIGCNVRRSGREVDVESISSRLCEVGCVSMLRKQSS